MTPSEFAKTIRDKHPGSYDDMPDEALASSVLKKYPEYSDMVQATDPAQKAAENFEFERGPNYPTAAMTDPTVDDAMIAQGVGGLAKGAAGMGLGAAKNLMAETIVPTLERKAGNQALRSMGASVGQVRQMGAEEARAAGKYGLDKGLVDIFSSEVGRDAKLKALSEQTGKTIGELRELAGEAAPGTAEKIGADLGPKYATGVYSGEQGGLQKALEEVKNAGTSHADLAKTATKLNDYAAGAKLTQPANAATDVANALSRENNAGIVQSLGADKGKQYVQALDEYSNQAPIKQFMARGEAKEAAGLGSNTAYGSVTGFLKNAAGHRLGAKTADFAAEVGKGSVDFANYLQSNAQSLGKFAAPLSHAFQTGGLQGVAATHYILSTTHPEYNEMMLDKEGAMKP